MVTWVGSCASQRRVWVTAAMLVVVTAVATVVEGNTYESHHPLSLENHLSRMVEHVDSSIWEKKKRLADGHSFAPDELDMEEDGVTIVQASMEEQETHPEDIQDYVNNAPWTRRSSSSHNQPSNTIDMQMIKLAAQNAQRVKTEGRCEVSQQRCEVIRSPHHPPDTTFLPRCALLHRCSEDIGCCPSEEDICSPAETETVDLFFFALGGMRVKVDAMTFVNHTRCSCQPRSIVTALGRLAIECKCPRFYSPTPVDGQCTCDCDIGKSRCRRFKKGRRYFSASDIRCISSGECMEPTCEYGPFLSRQRRCTKRRERERYITNRK